MNPDPKEHYARLRALTWDHLWRVEAPCFDAATPADRDASVALIRALGTVFTETGDPADHTQLTAWLINLLRDPSEKIRRYAMAALPKTSPGPQAEAALLDLWQRTNLERERKHLADTLDKIGGPATLAALGHSLPPGTAQKVHANIARDHTPGAIRLDRPILEISHLRLHLRCRSGLETIARAEAEDAARQHARFRVAAHGDALVTLIPTAIFALRDIYALRCFGTAGFHLATLPGDSPDEALAIARAITSPHATRILDAFTDGPARYRIEFIGRGHQRALVRAIAEHTYTLRPELLNDPHQATWAIDIHPAPGGGSLIELRPRLVPDPRFAYRQDDIPAASHPPLAACMARLAGPQPNETAWDPFCGSGLELIERALLGNIRHLHGTDLSQDALAIAKTNLAAAGLANTPTTLTCRDFRDFAHIPGLGPETLTLIITNPPMGRRVRVPNLRQLIADLLAVAATALKPGGRLIFPNPIRIDNPPRPLKLQSRQVVDLGGFNCWLEVYHKTRP